MRMYGKILGLPVDQMGRSSQNQTYSDFHERGIVAQ